MCAERARRRVARSRRRGNRGRGRGSAARCIIVSSSAVEVGDHEGDGAEDAAVRGDGGDDLGGEGRRRGTASMAKSDDGLQLDAAGPALAHLGEDRPGDAVLRRQRIEVGAEQRGAVGVGARRLKSMRRRDVVGRPVGVAVGRHRVERAHEGAVGIGPARPDVALVDVGVHVDEGRPDHAAVEVEPRRVRSAPAGGRCARSGRRRSTMSAATRPSASGSPGGSSSEDRRESWRWRGRSAARRGSRRSRVATLSSPGARRSRATSGAGGAR